MGLQQIALVFGLTLALSEALWRRRPAHNQHPGGFRDRPLAQIPQRLEPKVPQVSQSYGSSNPIVVLPQLPSQFPVQTPPKTDFGLPAQNDLSVQSKQLLQAPMANLAWSFPSLPEEPQQPAVPFELRNPLPANSVAAMCNEDSVHVEVRKDFFGIGYPLKSSGFTLGGCAPTGEDPSAQVLIFESELHGCGSISTMTQDVLVYIFSLIYTPQEASYGIPIARSSRAVVSVECHYPRMNNVSSEALMPSWMPYTSTVVAGELLMFSLKLMTDDWTSVRASYQYFLGDMINIEASVSLYYHVPFRIFVDSCVATSVPDITATPSYSFIDNNGCLVDAKLTGSSSHFLPRTQFNKLQFQLAAFRFQQPSELVYITCVLKVAAASAPTNVEQKACSFSSNGWVSADGDNQVCGCCDSTCGVTTASDAIPTDLYSNTAYVGPVMVKNNPYGPM